jgi:hypothetical protein
VKWLQTAGAVLELIGLICAAFGFRQTWYDYARGERFLEPMLRPVTSRARAVQNRLRKLLRRPGKPQVVQAGAAAAIGIAGSVTARVGLGTTTRSGYRPRRVRRRGDATDQRAAPEGAAAT